MGKLSNGPDWTDVMMTAWKLEEHHAVRITLLLQGDGAFGGLPVSGSAIAVPVRLDDPFEPMGWTSDLTWPSNTHSTLEGAFYAALLKLDDLLCEKRWHQVIIPA